MRTFFEFHNETAAREYRRSAGCGGWILVCDATGAATIFPPDMPPSAIFNHRMARGITGKLIGAA